MIRRVKGKFVLVSKSHPGKVLGVHGTRKEAEAQERAIQASKARRRRRGIR